MRQRELIDTHDVPYVSAQNWHTVPSAIFHKISEMVKSKVTSGEIPPSMHRVQEWRVGICVTLLYPAGHYVVVPQFLSIFPQQIQASFYHSSPPFKINCGI